MGIYPRTGVFYVYFAYEGYDENYDSSEWPGIYYSVSRAKEAYDLAVARLQAEHAEIK